MTKTQNPLNFSKKPIETGVKEKPNVIENGGTF